MITAAEEQPLLGSAAALPDLEDGPKHTEVMMDFEEGDAENPREWPASFKWFIVSLLAAMAFTVTFTCISVVPIAAQIAKDLGHGRPASASSALLVTIWEFGEAAGPLFIAPLSEVFGRYPVINGANLLFIAATLLAALSPSTPVFVAARALTGFAVASNVLNPAIIGDMFESDQRGTAMSLVLIAPLIGGAIGPAISGAITETLGWRQVLLIAAALAVACEVLLLACFKETYKMTILRRRAAELQRECGEFAAKPKLTAARRHEGLRNVWHSATRPFAVLGGSGVLMALALYGSVSFAYYYAMSVTLPGVLQTVYGLTPARIGLAFVIFSTGSLLSVIICNLTLDRIYIRLREVYKTAGQPEYRLPLAITGAFVLPFTIAAYGWIAELRLPFYLMAANLVLCGLALAMNMAPLFAYVVDACGIYSASAMTGMIVTRCLAGTFLPLSVGSLTDHLGYGWGFTLLGAVSLCLAPIPVLIMVYGRQWRQRSEYTKED